MIELSSDFTTTVASMQATVSTTFTVPSGKSYVGAGIKSISFTTISNQSGGINGTATITCSGQTISLSVPIRGNWSNQTAKGSVTLYVFVS